MFKKVQSFFKNPDEAPYAWAKYMVLFILSMRILQFASQYFAKTASLLLTLEVIASLLFAFISISKFTQTIIVNNRKLIAGKSGISIEKVAVNALLVLSIFLLSRLA